MRNHGRLLPIIFTGVLATSTVFSQPHLKQNDTRYYQIFTDLNDDIVREAKLRVDAMAETYHERTRSFSGQITKRMPFYLFSKPADYYAAGGMAGSAGVFDGQKLMAIAMPKRPANTWHVVQHEGFHQFAQAVIGGELPVWVNEGLAEYFGEGLYTGDAFVTGIVPPQRLARVQAWIKGGKTISIADMMRMTHEDWNGDLSIVNYDQAWSMTHFLAHAADGRYQEPFARFITQVSRNRPWQQAWDQTFGRGVKDFEQQWRSYWSNMSPDDAAPLYARATLLTLTSFYGRAFSQKQIFESYEKFNAAAHEGQLKMNARDWLPPTLLETAVTAADKQGGYSITHNSTGYHLVLQLPDGSKLIGSFQAANGQIKRESVNVEQQAGRARQP